MILTAYHGIGAYHGQRNPLALNAALNTVLSGVEVCASDRAIGAFGAVLTGIVDIVWARDVYSYVDTTKNYPHGRRACEKEPLLVRVKDLDGLPNCIFNHPDEVPAISSGDQADFEKFAWESIGRKNDSGRYTEAFMRGSGLVAIWVKSWADKRTIAAAQSIARRHGVPMLMIEGKERIWSVLEQLNMPLDEETGEVAPATAMAHAFCTAGVIT